jgi:hypothetical protein
LLIDTAEPGRGGIGAGAVPDAAAGWALEVTGRSIMVLSAPRRAGAR